MLRTGIALAGVLLLAACGEKQAAKAPEPVAATAPAVAAAPQQGDPYRGSAIAQQVCVQCHDVGVDGLTPRMQVGAPAFPAIANGDGTTAAGLADWMRKSHPAMPNFIFDDTSVSALSAYIMSLRTAP